MKINKRKLIEYILTSLFTIIIVYFLIKNLKMDVLFSLWEESNKTYLILGNLVYFTICIIRGERYKAAGAAATRIDLFSISAVNVFVNRLLPFKTGELFYAYLLKKIGSGKFTQGVVQLIQVRISDLLAVASLFFTTLLLTRFKKIGFQFELFFGVLGILAMLLFLYLPFFFKIFIKVLYKIINIFPTTSRQSLRDNLDKLGELIIDSAKLSKYRKTYLFIVSTIDWLCYYTMFYLLIRGFNFELPLLLVVLGSSGAIAGSILPFSVVGTFGALEGGWALGFVLVGMPQDEAVATGILMSMITLVYAIIVALTGLIILGIKYRWFIPDKKI